MTQLAFISASQCSRIYYLNLRLTNTSELGTETVVLMVGSRDQLESLKVYKNLLYKKAPVFSKVFNSPFTEGFARTATFPEDGPIPFKLFIDRLYQPLFHLVVVNINTS